MMLHNDLTVLMIIQNIRMMLYNNLMIIQNIRMMLDYAGVEYDDHVVQMAEWRAAGGPTPATASVRCRVWTH